ncbi:glycosyltransferase [Citrobacter sp. JGM124]|uniref:glycosyltransferase family 2 protein n=1 Tax=Citrobacter sp. JGM124 TaxID=2799789 RepID=UPI001BAAFAFF|nr:glycosyltransferase [Citrobacter sp. JGM124]MBS0847954.1 glycosyltransferase [Citrobacter sp. JGM124]
MSLISIVTATYNSEKYIKNVYSSILNQTHEKWEWVVTDDNSTDGTVSLLNDIASKDSRVTIKINKENLGAAHSRNRCLKSINGEYVAFIDSDDLWYPNKLELQLLFMSNQNINFSFTSYDIINNNGIKTGKEIDIKNKLSTYKYNDILKKRATLGCSTVMLRKSAIDDLTMPLLRTGQDYAFWLKILKSGEEAHLLKKILTSYRITPGSISRNKFKKAMRQWEIYRDLEGLDFYNSSVSFFHYAWRAIKRI